ncbi:LysR family transcriptional regulator [Cohaesibacter haloalkalitolerans]|uniref:LysR family transcriptional regulator n=1 Tax=Cohaesibacter haloalkalitolerans TaxID=1162980 RepID=UPI000E653DB8|nr:LysR family transcriptional regulator [Cohaesibacter haloalkalitolerans]
MDKLSVMTAYCRIVERGSFARAAEDLGVSAALLSKEIKLLEDSLGCVLLTRTTRSMSLSEAGQKYYAEALAILDAVGQLDGRIREAAGTVGGTLKINAPNSFGQEVIAPMLSAFLERHPDLRLTLSLDDHVVDMVEGGFDVSIRVRASLPDSSLIARRLGRMHQRLYAAPAYLERAGRLDSPEDIKAHRIVGFLLADHLSEWQLRGPGGPISVAFEPSLKVGNSLVLRDLLIAGYGIGTLPDFIALKPEQRGELVRVLPQYDLPPREIFAVTASRFGMNAKVSAFLDHLQSALKAFHR